MAYDPTINVQFDGERKYIHVFNIDASKDGSTGTTTIDVSALNTNKSGAACNRISLNKIWYNINPTAIADAARFTLSDKVSTNHEKSLKSYDLYIKNKKIREEAKARERKSRLAS